MSLSLTAFVFGIVELLMAQRICKRHGVRLGDDPGEIFAKLSLVDYLKIRAHVISCLAMWNLAGVLAWLPR